MGVKATIFVALLVLGIFAVVHTMAVSAEAPAQEKVTCKKTKGNNETLTVEIPWKAAEKLDGNGDWTCNLLD